MKTMVACLLAFMPAFSAFSQGKVKTLDDSAKAIIWSIQSEGKSAVMFLTEQYTHGDDTTGHLSITIEKNHGEGRPAFISIALPPNVNHDTGVYVQFAKAIKNDNGEWKRYPVKGDPLRFYFEKCDNEYCIARITGGYTADEITRAKIDVFQHFWDYNYVTFVFAYPDGQHKSVSVPLFSFRRQYQSMK